MPARRKNAKKRATTKRGRKTPDYPLLSLREYGELSSQEKVQFLEFLRHSEQQERGANLEKLLEAAPDLIKKGLEIYAEHFLRRVTLTLRSMLVHLGVLLFGTVAICWLGFEEVLDGATVVAILGPLYTYVLVNLRYLTGWKIVGDTSDSS